MIVKPVLGIRRNKHDIACFSHEVVAGRRGLHVVPPFVAVVAHIKRERDVAASGIGWQCDNRERDALRACQYLCSKNMCVTDDGYEGR